MSRIVASMCGLRRERELRRRSAIRWAIRTAVSAADRDELMEIAARNDVRR